MILRKKFKYIARGKQDLLVLIPGWASDQRIFCGLNLDFNYLLCGQVCPFTFKRQLWQHLKQNSLNQVSVFGWSLGGFLAAEFAAQYPDLINQLVLVSIRKKYNPQQLEQLRKRLIKNKETSLYKFYIRCFSTSKEAAWFRENLLKDYCSGLNLDYLLKGLDYLAGAQIDTGRLNSLKQIKIIHGQDDGIAPIEEAMAIAEELPQGRLITIRKAGHLPFLKPNFSTIYAR